MGLLSIFQNKSGAAPKSSAADAVADSVQQARTRARRRLIGAVVLVIVGVIGFPLLFETQPRPISVDIPIEIPRKDGALPLVMPAARPKTPAVAVAPAPVAPAASDIITESRTNAGREIAVAAAASAATPVAPEPAAAKTPVVTSKPVVKTPVAAADDTRALALLESKPPVSSVSNGEGARYVVQVGAFADAAAARDTRRKVEKLGLQTYTQVTDTAAGSRIRVRVGPFVSRDDAERALAKAKAGGVAAVVLTL